MANPRDSFEWLSRDASFPADSINFPPEFKEDLGLEAFVPWDSMGMLDYDSSSVMRIPSNTSNQHNMNANINFSNLSDNPAMNYQGSMFSSQESANSNSPPDMDFDMEDMDIDDQPELEEDNEDEDDDDYDEDDNIYKVTDDLNDYYNSQPGSQQQPQMTDHNLDDLVFVSPAAVSAVDGGSSSGKPFGPESFDFLGGYVDLDDACAVPPPPSALEFAEEQALLHEDLLLYNDLNMPFPPSQELQQLQQQQPQMNFTELASKVGEKLFSETNNPEKYRNALLNLQRVFSSQQYAGQPLSEGVQVVEPKALLNNEQLQSEPQHDQQQPIHQQQQVFPVGSPLMVPSSSSVSPDSVSSSSSASSSEYSLDSPEVARVEEIQASKKKASTSAGVNSNTKVHFCKLVNPATQEPCNKKFSRPYDLIRHQDTIHAAVRKTFQCDICGSNSKTFSRMDALTRHIRVKHS